MTRANGLAKCVAGDCAMVHRAFYQASNVHSVIQRFPQSSESTALD
jgi:hypothetical protein